MGGWIKWIFSSTVKCVGKCGGEWVKGYHSVVRSTIPLTIILLTL